VRCARHAPGCRLGVLARKFPSSKSDGEAKILTHKLIHSERFLQSFSALWQPRLESKSLIIRVRLDCHSTGPGFESGCPRPSFEALARNRQEVTLIHLNHRLRFPKYPVDQLALRLSLFWRSRLRRKVEGDRAVCMAQQLLHDHRPGRSLAALARQPDSVPNR